MQKKVRYPTIGLPALPLGLLCFLFAIPFNTHAQTDTAKKLKEVKIKTAPLPAIQTITPSQQLSASDFDRYSAINVADAVRDFAGVNIKDYGGIGGLKTISVRGLGANHTAILYDGVEINDAENGQIDLGKLNLNGIQQVALYNAQPADILATARSFASASILSLTTVKPMLPAIKPYQVLIGIKAGSFGLINPYLQWQQRISSNWSFVVNSYLENGSGEYKYKTNLNGYDTTQTRTNTEVRDLQTDGTLYWTKNDSNKFYLHINYYHSDRGLPGAVINTNPLSTQRLWNQDLFLQSGYEHSWQKQWQLLISAKLSQELTRYLDPEFLNNNGGIDDRYTQWEAYLSVALAYHITTAWQISYATDVSYSTLGAGSVDSSLYNYAYPKRFTLLNVFASKLKLGKWLLQGDLLHTFVDEQVKTGKATPGRTDLSPTLMASLQPFKDPDLQLRAFYKNIFREPTFDEQYFFAINGSRNLKPEFAKQFDLGTSYRKSLDGLMDFIAFTLDGYYNFVTNKIVAIPNQNLELLSITNLGKVRIEGADISIKTQTKAIDNWRGVLAVNYGYQYAVDVDLNSAYYLQQIAYTPKNTAAINAGAEYNRMGLYFNQVLSSSRYYLGQSIPQNFVEGYAVSDLSFVSRFSADDKPITFSAHINNLFNENYMVVRSFPMPGRSFLISIQITI